MTINKQALRTVAAAAKSAPSWYAVGKFGDVVDPAKAEWKPVYEFCKTFTAERVLALLDELDKWQQESSAWQAVAEKQLALATDAEKQIAELVAAGIITKVGE